MSNFLEFLSNNELTIVICLMVIIFGLIMTIIIIDIFSRKTTNVNLIEEDEEEYDDELDRTDIDINTTGLGMVANESLLDEIDVEAVTKNLEKTQEIEEIKYVEEDEDLEKTKALLELETIKQELAKIENQDFLEETTEQQPIEIEQDVETVINDEYEIVQEENIQPIDKEPSVSTIEEEVNKFESDQEEHAIISVDELVKASENITDEEIEQYEDDGNEPISIKELEAMYKSIEEPISELEETKSIEKEEKISLPDFEIKVKPAIDAYDDKNFKNTPVISPVFGLKQNESSISLEHTANLDKLNEEIKKTNEFLAMLKELRKNLD